MLEHSSIRSVRVRLVLAVALLSVATAGCKVDKPKPEALDSDARTPYRHPLSALARVEGPTPLFEALDDPAGNRYLVGEGGGIDEEGGPERTVSGLFVASRRSIRPGEITKSDPPLERTPLPKLTPELAERLAGTPADSRLEVLISLRGELPGRQAELERDLAQGRIRFHDDLDRRRSDLTGDRQRRVAALLGPVASAIEATGGTVLRPCRNSPCLIASVPAGALTTLAARPEVVDLGLVGEVVPPDEEDLDLAAAPTIVTGVTVRQGAQIQQFLDNSYDGNGLSELLEGDNVVVAVVESAGPNAGYLSHDGYREHDPDSSFRFAEGGGATGLWQCTPDGCESVKAFPVAGSHATGAAGILFGDLEDGQLPATEAAVRPTASGYSPEARAHLYAFNGGSELTLDHVGSLTPAQNVPDLVSNAWGTYDSPRCSGTNGAARAANRLYQDGIAVFAAVHNNGGSSTQCQTTAPASAIGAFGVGAHLWGYEGTALTVRTAPIYESDGGNESSWGGNPNQGQNRSLVGLTATGTRANKFNTSGSFSQTGVICCTSLATPTVAGAAADFIDFYRDRWSHFIDNPGSLYANMLLMGDRQTLAGKGLSSLSHRWGAGRLRMRMFNGEGMDAPWYYFNGWTCISHQEIWDFPVGNGGGLSQDFDAIKAAAYWFDARHDGTLDPDQAGAVADVDLWLWDPVTNSQLSVDDDRFDNKARAFVANAGGHHVNLRLVGFDVHGHDDPVCGEDAVRVFFAYFAEDSDRESPTFDATTGLGIFPESF